MKKILNAGIVGLMLMIGFSSCTKFLDINKNPNQPTSSTPELVLPQALTGAATVMNNYNTMGAQLGGYMANAGGYGGFGANVTYDFSAGDYANCWNTTYDNLTDFQWIITNTTEDPTYAYFSAVSKIMKAFEFQLLVDTYNDLPYAEAFQENQKLTPVYDDAKSVYTAIYALLDEAIGEIKSASGSEKELGTADVVFGGDTDAWIRFANTIKLRIAIRGKAGGLSLTGDYSDGFITKDVLVNPGFRKENGKQNPTYNNWAYTYSGTPGNRAWMPTQFVYNFYFGKLTDYRGYAIFNPYDNFDRGTNQLGYEGNDVEKAAAAGNWTYTGSDQKSDNNIGLMKGPGAGRPLITLAEADFLQAEAALDGGLGVTGDAEELFNKGVKDSYRYVYSRLDGTFDLGGWDPQADYEAYLDLNDSYLVHFENTSSNAEKLEAIITQKYIAVNMINSDQGWNDFRRTGFPKIVNGSSDGLLTFASTQSKSTRPDKLISRVLYPTSERSYNNANMPKDITVFTSRIFWDAD